VVSTTAWESFAKAVDAQHDAIDEFGVDYSYEIVEMGARTNPERYYAKRIIDTRGGLQQWLVWDSQRRMAVTSAGGHHTAVEDAERLNREEMFDEIILDEELTQENPMARSNPLPPTVRGFLEVLIAHLTQYDRRVSMAEARRGSANIYRLGLLLEQQEKIAAELKGRLDSSEPADLQRLKQQIQRKFIVTDMPPAKKTIAAIDDYLQSGKSPVYPGAEKKSRSTKKSASAPRANPDDTHVRRLASRLARGG